MAVPTQGELYHPVLEITATSLVKLTHKQLTDDIVNHLGLTEEDVQERTSTNASRLGANLGFALSALSRAGLLNRPERGLFVISEKGRELLRTHTGRIGRATVKMLFEQKRAGSTQVRRLVPGDSEKEEDPSKKMVQGYRAIRENLISDLVDNLLDMPPDGFERLALTLLERLGYGRGNVVGQSGDDGVDVIINQDALGLEKVYVQAKRWRQSVGAGEIRDFSGSLQLRGAAKGVFVTTSHFTKSAKDTAERISQSNQTILLIDGRELASLMFDNDVGVITHDTFTVKKLDGNYFAEI